MFRVTPVTAMTFDLTVTSQVAVKPPSFVRTVMVALPTAFAVTTPEEETVATEVLLDDQVTVLSVALVGVMVAIKVWVSPSTMNRDVWFRDMPVTETGLTVTTQVAFLPPSFVVTVIVDVPTASADTTPDDVTEATFVLLEDQVTDWSAASKGDTVAVSTCVSPTFIDNDVLSRETPETATGFTVTSQVAFFPPSTVVTVMVAVPTVFAVMTPVEETVATAVLLEDQVTDLFVALVGVTTAVSVSVSPTVMVRVVWFRLTPVTATVAALTVTVQEAVLLPSTVLTVIVAVPAL